MVNVGINDVLGKLDKNVFFIESSKTNSLETSEVEGVIYDATNKAAAFLQLTSVDDIPANQIVDNAVAVYAAGLLWNQKLGGKVVPAGYEGAGGKTYGDKLIDSAKEDLAPFKPETATKTGAKISFYTVSGEDEEEEDIADYNLNNDAPPEPLT